MVLAHNAQFPIATFSYPPTLDLRDSLPIAVLSYPVVLLIKEPLPIAMLLSIFPPPLPIAIPFTFNVSLLNVRVDSASIEVVVPFEVNIRVFALLLIVIDAPPITSPPSVGPSYINNRLSTAIFVPLLPDIPDVPYIPLPKFITSYINFIYYKNILCKI